MESSTRVPSYVLNAPSGPLGPDLNAATLGGPATVIYGFTNKSTYDIYLKNSPGHGELLPYPLIKRYMQGQIESGHDVSRLVAIDCVSPTQSTLSAATMQSIVDALEHKHDSVAITHTLSLDATGLAYHVETCVPAPQPIHK